MDWKAQLLQMAEDFAAQVAGSTQSTAPGLKRYIGFPMTPFIPGRGRIMYLGDSDDLPGVGEIIMVESDGEMLAKQVVDLEASTNGKVGIALRDHQADESRGKPTRKCMNCGHLCYGDDYACSPECQSALNY